MPTPFTVSHGLALYLMLSVIQCCYNALLVYRYLFYLYICPYPLPANPDQTSGEVCSTAAKVVTVATTRCIRHIQLLAQDMGGNNIFSSIKSYCQRSIRAAPPSSRDELLIEPVKQQWRMSFVKFTMKIYIKYYLPWVGQSPQ